MPVTDEQVAPLRAQLARQPAESQRLFDFLDPAAKRTGYRSLVSAAFVIAAQRRFAPNVSTDEVIEFVGDVRSRSPEVADKVDPATAERVMMAVYTGQPIDDVAPRTGWETQLVPMAAIIGDEHLDDAGLDAFLAGARKLADQWLA